MFKLSTALIFVNFMRVIHAGDPSNQIGQDLVAITPGHELPLVLFDVITEIETKHPLSREITNEKMQILSEGGNLIIRNDFTFRTLKGDLSITIRQLQVPDDSFKPEVKEGRLVEGTEFISKSSTKQIFFCPKVESENNCLAPREFTESQPLECHTEAIPDVRYDASPGKCGPDDSGDLYRIGYDICPAEQPYSYLTDRIEFYHLCYDDDNKSTVFTQHSITSPNLLKSHMLAKEREVTYPYKDSSFKQSIFEDSFNTDLESLVHPQKPAYKVQKLVPDENMAFALWRKTTYKNYNVNWQHTTLAPLWDKINDYIRSHATKVTNENDKIQYSVHTGVFDIPSTFEDDQMSNIWISMITILPKSLDRILSTNLRGIAVLMNNFITVKTHDSALETPSRQREMVIKKYCELSKCTKALLDGFGAVGGRVRCCPITKEIGKLFDATGLGAMPRLKIPGINVKIPDL